LADLLTIHSPKFAVTLLYSQMWDVHLIVPIGVCVYYESLRNAHASVSRPSLATASKHAS